MNTYNYEEAVKLDIIDYLDEHYANERIDEGMREKIYDDLWVADSVTGNGSGSYTFSTYKAEENLCHNLDLLGKAMNEFEDTGNILEKAQRLAMSPSVCTLWDSYLTIALKPIMQQLKTRTRTRSNPRPFFKQPKRTRHASVRAVW